MNAITLPTPIPLLHKLRNNNVEDLFPRNYAHLSTMRKIQDTAIANDEALLRLCELKPEHSESYRRQWEQAEADLVKRARKIWPSGC